METENLSSICFSTWEEYVYIVCLFTILPHTFSSNFFLNDWDVIKWQKCLLLTGTTQGRAVHTGKSRPARERIGK
jgi:hypothetical protein